MSRTANAAPRTLTAALLSNPAASPYLAPLRLSSNTRVSDAFITVSRVDSVQVLSFFQLLTLLEVPRPGVPGQRLIVCTKQSKHVTKSRRSHEYKTTVYCELTRQFYRASHATGARSLLKSVALKHPWVQLLRVGERYQYRPPMSGQRPLPARMRALAWGDTPPEDDEAPS